MSPTSAVDSLDNDFLTRHYDQRTLQRGADYALDDRVRVLKSEPGRIDAVCRGAGGSYVVRIRWSGPTGAIVFDDTCTCPVGEGCKHCVATILTARPRTPPASETTARSDGDAHWRRSLIDLPTDDDDVPDAAVNALALQFTVKHPRPSRYQVDTDPVVSVRPMRLGASGKWIKTGASWTDLASPYSHYRIDADPRQLAALRALLASGRMAPYSSGNVAVPLAQFGPDVWYQLERAVEVGIVLVGERPGEVVELSSTPARATIDVTAGAGGAVTLEAGFRLGDRPLTVHGDGGGLLGGPPHGLWTFDEDGLHLRPLDRPLHPTVARLMSRPLTVPAGDVDELLDVYVPALARHAAVASPDGSVTIAETRFDGLVLAVDRPAVDAAILRWTVRYRRGERAVEHPLGRPGGHGRDRTAEAAALRELELPTHLLAGLVHPDGSPRDLHVTGAEAITVLTEVIPWLEANTDVTVEQSGDQPSLREALGDPLVSLTVRDADDTRDGNDWFDLGVEVSVDGQTVDFVSLFTALDRGERAMVLPSGTWLRLEVPELARLRSLIEEARGLAEPGGSAAARVNRFQTSWWEELVELGVVAEQSERWAANVARMGALAAPEPISPPAGLAAELRHYQQEGLDWLVFLHRNRLGGILADDMGLGKTVQTLALCLHVLESDPDARFLVVAPTSVVENWAHEAARFAPGVAIRSIRETHARRGTTLVEEIADARIVVTSYALFRLEFDDYTALRWDLLVLDEAQFVKNHQGKTHHCARRLDVATKIAVTGTPLENTLMDLWSLLSITAPGLYPDPRRFNETYRRPIERGDAPELLATLRRRIAPLLRRRTKDEVLTELPPKTEQTVEVEMGARHARIYQTQLQRQRQKVLGLVGDVHKHRFEILKSLTLLRQLALDPGLVDPAHDHVGSAKLDLLVEDLTQVVAEGHRALVFSQFTRFLARARTRLDDAGIAYSYLDGRTRRRDVAIARFKDGEVPVFVISLKAGGFGLNLTEADYCFVLDPWWNPATETQAVDRAHRIGQQNPVMVYRYVSEGTIEEKVMELKARKADLFASVMDAEGALAGALTEDDIRGLLDLG